MGDALAIAAKRYACSMYRWVTQNNCKIWCLSRLCRDEAGTIRDFQREFQEDRFTIKEESFMTNNSVKNGPKCFLRTYMDTIGFVACEESYEWPDEATKHTTYLRGQYEVDRDLLLDVLIMVRQIILAPDGRLLVNIKVACQSSSMARLLTRVPLLIK